LDEELGTHELLHKCHRDEATRQQRELEAESVSYAVLAHYGIHSESRFYLASYGFSAEMLTASLQIISQTARKIIDTIEGSQKEMEDAAVEAAPLETAAWGRS
jgi:hypothetical protein